MASSAHATTWSAAGFLASHSLDQLIADQLLAAKPPTASELDHLKSLDRDQTLQLIVGGSSLPFHLELGEAVWAALSKLNAVKVASASELHGKFVQDGDAFTLAYGTLSTFFGGLQGLIGAPDAKLEQSMAREHLDSADSKLMFRTSNYGMDTSSELEFHFVVDPQTGQQLLGIDAYPVERAQAGQHYRRLLPPEHFAEELEAVNGRLDALGEPRMLREEFLAARLYTIGPDVHEVQPGAARGRLGQRAAARADEHELPRQPVRDDAARDQLERRQAGQADEGDQGVPRHRGRRAARRLLGARRVRRARWL